MEASCQLTLAKLPPAGGSSANRPTSAHHPQGDTMQKESAYAMTHLCNETTPANHGRLRVRGHRIRERDLRPQRGLQRVSLPTSKKRLYPCAAAIASPASQAAPVAAAIFPMLSSGLTCASAAAELKPETTPSGGLGSSEIIGVREISGVDSKTFV